MYESAVTAPKSYSLGRQEEAQPWTDQNKTARWQPVLFCILDRGWRTVNNPSIKEVYSLNSLGIRQAVFPITEEVGDGFHQMIAILEVEMAGQCIRLG